MQDTIIPAATSSAGLPDATRSLTGLPLARYRFLLRTLQPARLPRPAGSLWRGVLGKMLHETVCLMPAQRCSDCLLSSHCVYPQFFERVSEHGAYGAPPRPFVPEYQGPWGVVAAGELLELRLVVFGSANITLPYLIVAIQRLAGAGIGRERSKLSLERVEQQQPDSPDCWQPIVDTRILKLQPLPASIPTVPPVPATVRVRLLEPLRLKQRGQLVKPQQFSATLFLRALQRRYRLLAERFDADPAPRLTDDVTALQLTNRQLRWHDWTRWSARQRSEMQLGGLLGQFDLGGDALAACWPLLWWGQWLHVGSATSFGIGGFVLELPTTTEPISRSVTTPAVTFRPTETESN